MSPITHDLFNLLVIHGDAAVRDTIGAAARDTRRFRSLRAMANARFALEWMLERGDLHSPAMPEIVVLDLDLPGLNGVQFTRELRRADPSRQIFIAFFATAATALEQDAAESAGADYFVRRPADFETLARQLTSLANRVETDRAYPRLDALFASDYFGCAMLNDNVVL